MATTSAWRLTRVEMVTMRPTPAACARATTASSSPAKSGKSRWQWLSISMRYARDCGRRAARPGVLASMPHIGRRRVGVLLLEVGDLACQILEQAPALRRRVVDRQLRDRLAERRDDLVHVENVLVAAGCAVFRVELVDHVGDQAVQTWPLVVRSGFIVSHGAILSSVRFLRCRYNGGTPGLVPADLSRRQSGARRRAPRNCAPRPERRAGRAT